jgi:Ca-activated chloride channel family protein
MEDPSIAFRGGIMKIQRLLVLGTIFVLPSQATPAGQIPSGNRSIKVDVNVVSVNVTVTDGRNRYVQGLERERFRVWEDRIEQKVRYFSTEDAPFTLGIVMDTSGSMGYSKQLQPAQLSAASCLQGGVRDDEYFVIEFNDKPRLVADFTARMSTLKEQLLYLRPGGRTALWDAIYMAVAKLEGASNPRKALLVLTDGAENHSRYSLSELKSFLREKDVRIYFFGDGVDQLANLTGGRVFASSNPCQELKADLANQYVLGYEPTNTEADGRWREIRVRVDSSGVPKELSGLSVRARAGYYAARGSDVGKD